MLQYRLSTLFLIFFVVAATMALFGVAGICLSVALFLSALCLNRVERMITGIISSGLIVFGLIFLGFAVSTAREAALRANCSGLHLGMIGLGIANYRDAHKQFPPICVCDKTGRPLRSWLVEIMPHLEEDDIYNQLNKDEPWNSPHNVQVLPRTIEEFTCPSVNRDADDCSSNYMAIIGPGTIWKAEGSKTLSDLPNGSTHAVVAVEVVNSGKHWAEPSALTVDEVLENTRTGKGVRISSCHPAGVNVLFADSFVRTFPNKMPLSLWRKILSGEFNRFDDLESQIDPNAPDMVDVYVAPLASKPWPIILGVVVWLISIVLLFRRSVKSRKKPETVIQPAAA